MHRAVLAASIGSVIATVQLAAQAAPKPRTRHVILLTIDGVRGQELFGGMDSAIAAGGDSNGIHDLERLKRDYWRESADARRRALMP
ncbi:MAG: AP protein, partial [Gemmatimonadota bacterium]